MNYKSISIAVIIIFLSYSLYSQIQPIDVTDQTVKLAGLGGEETLYFGFNTGDQILFNFSEVDGKELKDIEVSEYPSNTKYADYKISQVQNKIINVDRKGVWSFHFSNSAIAGRVCKIKIQRIPASEATSKFNTDVIWKNFNDTSYTEETERYLEKSDTEASNFFQQTVLIHSTGSLEYGCRNIASFTLPENTIAWGYYIGVNEEKSKAFAKATADFTKDASKFVSTIPEYGPLAALALKGVSCFTQLNSGDGVDFYIVDNNNASLFNAGQQVIKAYKYGTQVVNSFSRMKEPLSGSYFLCLKNDNYVTPINVTIKMTAITAKQQWGTRPVRKMNIVTRKIAFNADNN